MVREYQSKTNFQLSTLKQKIYRNEVEIYRNEVEIYRNEIETIEFPKSKKCELRIVNSTMGNSKIITADRI